MSQGALLNFADSYIDYYKQEEQGANLAHQEAKNIPPRMSLRIVNPAAPRMRKRKP